MMTTNFYELCRQNTGRAMCDSGDHYGRHYEQPPIPEDAPMIREWNEDCPATIETATYLTERYSIDERVQRHWVSWDKTHSDELNWFESAEQFMKMKGYESCARDNVYNVENDLSQVFIWEVWRRPDREQMEWVYDDEAIIVIHTHTGCDVRGGYSSPAFCRTKCPVDLCAGYRVIEAQDTNGIALTQEQCRELDEKWCTGYSNYPYGELEKDVANWQQFTRTRDSVYVLLHDGTLAKVEAYI